MTLLLFAHLFQLQQVVFDQRQLCRPRMKRTANYPFSRRIRNQTKQTIWLTKGVSSQKKFEPIALNLSASVHLVDSYPSPRNVIGVHHGSLFFHIFFLKRVLIRSLLDKNKPAHAPREVAIKIAVAAVNPICAHRYGTLLDIAALPKLDNLCEPFAKRTKWIHEGINVVTSAHHFFSEFVQLWTNSNS